MARTTARELEAQFAEALDCKTKFVAVRLRALGHESVCSRCAGSGHYSRNQITGTTCFGCNGRGWQRPKLTATLLKTVAEQVTNGELEPYFAECRRKHAAKKFTEKAVGRLSAAWRKQPNVADFEGVHFTDCPEKHHAVNFACAPMHSAVNQLAGFITSGRWNEDLKQLVPLTADESERAVAAIRIAIDMVGFSQEYLEICGEVTRDAGRALSEKWQDRLDEIVGFEFTRRGKKK